MPEHNAEVQSKVQETLEGTPGVTVRELYEMAQSMDPSLSELSLRQFNGSYVLPLKRARARAEGTPKSGRSRRGKRAEKAGGRGRGRKTAQGQEATAAEPSPPRRRSPRAQQGSEPAAAQGAGKEEVRGVLLEFARDLTAAESALEIIEVMGKLDGYAERILEAAKR